MRKFLWLLLISLAGDISAVNGVPSKETREFEFELTDVYYPLLNEAQNVELKKKMPWGLYISTSYRGEVTETISPKRWAEAFVYGASPVEKSITSDYVWVANASVNGTKIRFKVPTNINKDSDYDGFHTRGSIPIEGFSVYLPIDYLGVTLGKSLSADENINFDNRYFELFFNVVPYSGELISNYPEFYTKQYRYVRDYKVPWSNLIVGSSLDSLFMGADLWAVLKVSEVNKDGSLSDKPLVANTNKYGSRYLYDKPLLSKETKMSSIPAGDEKYYVRHIEKDGISVNLSKTIPLNVKDIRARYIKDTALEQFTLYAPVKYKSATSQQYDQYLTNFFLSETKTNGKLFRIDGRAGYQDNFSYYLSTDKETFPDCIFDYSIQFHAEGTTRFFRRPATNEHLDKEKYRYVGYEKSVVWSDIKNGDVSPLGEYEKDLRKWFAGQEDAEAKIAACKLLLDHAKYILSASEEKLNKEFDTEYKTIEIEYNKLLKKGFLVVGKKDGKPSGDGITYYANGEQFHAAYKDGGKITDAKMIYPNGNIFRYDTNAQKDYTSNAAYGKLHFAHDDATCAAEKFINGKAWGKGRIEIRQKESIYNFTFTGNFTNGVADGTADIVIEFSNALIRSPFYNRIKVANGKFTGNTVFKHWGEILKDEEGEEQRDYGEEQRDYIGEYAVTFKDGKISSGMDTSRAEKINAQIAKIYPIECDVHKTFGVKQ